MLCDQPSGRKNREIHGCGSRLDQGYPYPKADLTVITVKMQGSGWSYEMEPIVLYLDMSYL